jgi:hypothetical protein
MNDDELMTMMRESVTDIHTATPVEQIVGRGRRLRARRRVPLLTGALAVAAGTALALTALLPSSRPASHPAIRLAAWTVVKKQDGEVRITIREFRNAAGLQRKLRKDDVPASVQFYPGRLTRGVPFRMLFQIKRNPCHAFSGGQGQLLKVVPDHRAPIAPKTVITIVPSALPSGAGIQFIATQNVGVPHTANTRHALGVWLVGASGRCTGG